MIKIYTICGSMKFSNQMKDIAWELETVHGYSILQCVYNEQNLDVSENTIEMLNKLHYSKIDLSDGIYVVDIDEYVGSAVKSEIHYAKTKGKEIIYHSKFQKNNYSL